MTDQIASEAEIETEREQEPMSHNTATDESLSVHQHIVDLLASSGIAVKGQTPSWEQATEQATTAREDDRGAAQVEPIGATVSLAAEAQNESQDGQGATVTTEAQEPLTVCIYQKGKWEIRAALRQAIIAGLDAINQTPLDMSDIAAFETVGLLALSEAQAAWLAGAGDPAKNYSEVWRFMLEWRRLHRALQPQGGVRSSHQQVGQKTLGAPRQAKAPKAPKAPKPAKPGAAPTVITPETAMCANGCGKPARTGMHFCSVTCASDFAESSLRVEGVMWCPLCQAWKHEDDHDEAAHSVAEVPEAALGDQDEDQDEESDEESDEYEDYEDDDDQDL
jgi:hypothetical protein